MVDDFNSQLSNFEERLSIKAPLQDSEDPKIKNVTKEVDELISFETKVNFLANYFERKLAEVEAK